MQIKQTLTSYIDTEAVKWYTKAAEQGHAAAQTNLGLMYMLACRLQFYSHSITK